MPCWHALRKCRNCCRLLEVLRIVDDAHKEGAGWALGYFLACRLDVGSENRIALVRHEASVGSAAAYAATPPKHAQ
jgi:hypothetical protein